MTSCVIKTIGPKWVSIQNMKCKAMSYDSMNKHTLKINWGKDNGFDA